MIFEDDNLTPKIHGRNIFNHGLYVIMWKIELDTLDLVPFLSHAT